MKQDSITKESHIEWIGKIPNKWELKKVKFITKILYGNPLPEEKRKKGDIPVYGSNGIVGWHNESITNSETMIIGRKGSIGEINFSENPCFPIDTTFYVENTTTKHNLKWISYCLQCLNLTELNQDSAIPGLSREEIYNSKIPHSQENEKQIVDFLKKKLEEIDLGIEKNIELIKLLKEKRLVTIHQAVTKGLDPKITTKNSKMEWIGEVPTHWTIQKIAWAFYTIGGGTTPKSGEKKYYDGKIPWVNSGDLIDDRINIIENFITEKALEDYTGLKYHPKDTLIIAMYGASIGKLGILNFPCTTNQACCNLANSNKINYKFLFYWFLANRDNIISRAQGGGQPNISQDVIKNIRLFVPKNEEQKQISDYLDEEITKINEVIIKIECQIKQLKEFRQSTISYGVTGKWLIT